MLRWDESEGECEEDMGAECRREDLLREVSDGLDIHGWLMDLAAASRPARSASICGCEDQTLKSEIKCIHAHTV